MTFKIITNQHPPEAVTPEYEEIRQIIHAYRLLNPYYRAEAREDLAILLSSQRSWTARGFTDWDALRAYMNGEITEDPRAPYRNNSR